MHKLQRLVGADWISIGGWDHSDIATAQCYSRRFGSGRYRVMGIGQHKPLAEWLLTITIDGIVDGVIQHDSNESVSY